jgi:hypothetical protein
VDAPHLADVWHLDLKVVQAEFTLVGVNPALPGSIEQREPSTQKLDQC